MATTEPMNTADEEVVDKQSKKTKRGRDLEIEELRDVLASKSGRKVLMRYMTQAGLLTPSYTGSSNQTCFHEGSRAVALRIHQDIMEANPDAFILMQKEARQ
jgi:hypothetical protein